jgi:hypothetical protein
MLHVTGPGALRMSFSLEVFAELGRDIVYLKYLYLWKFKHNCLKIGISINWSLIFERLHEGETVGILSTHSVTD